MIRILKPETTRGGAPSHSPPDVRYAPGRALGRALGWFSIGLGLAEVLTPGAITRLTGVKDQSLLQTYGVREIASGLGVLSCDRPASWMWGRVAGDVCDLSTLANAMKDAETRHTAEAAFLAVAGVTVLDVLTALQLTTAITSEG